MEIKTLKLDFVHAHCNECDWNITAESNSPEDIARLENEIFNHLEETEHKVTLTIETIKDYFIE